MRRRISLYIILYFLVFNSSGIAQNLLMADTTMTDSINLNKKIVPDSDRKEQVVLYTGEDLVEDSFRGSWPMFGSGLRMKIGGYVKADLVYDFNGTLDPTQFLMSTIPVEGQPEHGGRAYMNFFARETRFNIDVRRTQGTVPLKLFPEKPQGGSAPCLQNRRHSPNPAAGRNRKAPLPKSRYGRRRPVPDSLRKHSKTHRIRIFPYNC